MSALLQSDLIMFETDSFFLFLPCESREEEEDIELFKRLTRYYLPAMMMSCSDY